MIDVNTIENILKAKSRGPYTRLEEAIAYEGKYGIGVRIPVKIEDVSGDSRVERIVLLDTIEEVEEFAELFDFSTEVVANGQYDPVIAPIFYRDNKRITLEDKKSDSKDRNNDIKRKIQDYKKLNGYLSERKAKFEGSLDMINAETYEKVLLKKELEELIDLAVKGKLKDTEEEDDFPEYKASKYILDFKENDNFAKMLSEEERKFKELAVIKDNFQRKEVCDNMKRLAIITIEKDMLNEEIAYVKTLTSKGLFNRKSVKKEDVLEELERIQNKYDIPEFQDIDIDQEKTELRIEQLLLKLPLEDRLDTIQRFDRLSYLEDRSDFVERLEEEAKEKETIKDSEEGIKVDELYKKSPSYKKQEIIKSLKRQFNENLTKEQKDALMIYQTPLFLPMSILSSVPNYKEREAKELIDELRKANGFEYIQRAVKNLSHYAKTNSTELSKVLRKVVPAKTDNDFIRSLIKQIEIINSIPPEAMVLKDDAILYRGLQGESKVDWEKPAKGLFMSTSLDSDVAKKYDKKGKIYKFNLRKGSPVLYTPYKIRIIDSSIPTTYEVVEEQEVKNQKNELILNMRFYKPLEHTILHEVKDVKFNDKIGDFEVKQSYFLYEADIPVKEDVTKRISNK